MSAASTAFAPTDPRDALRAAPMSALQRTAVFVTVALSALDGFDVLAVTLAAPGFSAEWQLDPAGIGFVLSAGLIGMAFGSLLFAPLADVFGRRRMILADLALMGAGMAGGAASQDAGALSLWRILTGLGVGGMVPVINPIATEFANARWRDFAVSLMAIGYPIGGVLGGLAATILLRDYDWRVLFWLGAALSVVMTPVVVLWLPEPLSFLIEKPDPASLDQANRLLTRCGLPAVSALPPPRLAADRVRVAALFEPAHAGATLQVTTVSVIYVVAVYCILSWVPQIVADLGFAPAQAASVSLVISLAGIAGGALIGWVAAYFPIRVLAAGATLGFAVLLAAFGVTGGADLGALRAVAAVLGFFLFAGSCALHAVISRSFDDHVRATGAGFALGAGRAASALAPWATGALFAIGLTRQSLAFGLALALLVGGLLTARLATLRAAESR